MPLYVDLHYIHSDNFTEEDAFRAHLADLNVQDKFGVTHKKFWINFEQKTMFCLVEGPDKEACNAAHQMAHMDHACNIIEVSNEEFVSFLGIGKKNRHDMALTLSGKIDSGYRTILMLRFVDISGEHENYTIGINKVINQFGGTTVPHPHQNILASFIHAANAVECSLAILGFLKSLSNTIDYSMALVTGRPVDDQGNVLFEEAKNKAQYLCQMGGTNRIYLDEETKVLTQKDSYASGLDYSTFKIMNKDDFRFTEVLFKIIDEKLNHSDLKSDLLGKKLGLSKAQAYRKIKALTGMSPNELIREMRLRRSLSFLQKNNKTVAEIAYYIGFNSPTYFTRVFRKRYKMLPTTFAKLST